MKIMRRALLGAFIVTAGLGSVAIGSARAADTPTSAAGTKLVTAADVQKAQAAGAVVIDTRIASEYAEEHIAGALNVPYHEKSAKAPDFDASQDEFNLAKLPANKAAPVVLYCNGPSCWKSYKASVTAVKGGYTGVLWYRDGFPDWKAKGLPSE